MNWNGSAWGRNRDKSGNFETNIKRSSEKELNVAIKDLEQRGYVLISRSDDTKYSRNYKKADFGQYKPDSELYYQTFHAKMRKIV